MDLSSPLISVFCCQPGLPTDVNIGHVSKESLSGSNFGEISEHFGGAGS